mgnify:CR=1 FL=1
MDMSRNNSGQVLLIAALAIALIISSLMLYVYETSQSVSSADRSLGLNGFIRNVKMGSRNLVIGSLANISSGGENKTLRINLQRWRSFVESHYYAGKCSLSYELCEDSPYSSGLWMYWGTEGLGVSSAEVDFSLSLSDKSGGADVAYSINITTHIEISAVSKWILESHVVNVTIHLFNEGSPALCRNITIYYKTSFNGIWRDASTSNDYLLKDYGNGTYIARFTIKGQPRVYNREIMVECFDRRDIFVKAVTRCVDL